jgi:hypothetical protein
MIGRLRDSRLALTLLSLIVVSWLLLGALSLSMPRSGGAQVSSQEGSPVSTILGLLLMVPIGWWAFARATGYLWKMNSGISWKLMMCTGAIGLTVVALAYDLVVIIIVNRLYIGAEDAEYMILSSDSAESTMVADRDRPLRTPKELEGRIARTLDNGLVIYQERNLSSAIVARPRERTMIQFGLLSEFEGRKWLEAALIDGPKGYVTGTDAQNHSIPAES